MGADGKLEGVRLPPFWHVVPAGEPIPAEGRPLVLTPGPGFGTGGHATARTNAALNGVADRVRAAHDLAPAGTLILSGLVATDVPAMSVRYQALLGGRRPEVYARGEWRALVWRGAR